MAKHIIKNICIWIFIIAQTIILPYKAQAQNAGINTPGIRMTLAQKNAMSSPPTGLMIYQTDGTPGFYYNSGTPEAPVWSVVGGGSGGLPASVDGQILKSIGGVPTWVNTIPTITTTAISDITTPTANSGGSISSDGGAAVTARGVCWSTSHNPDVFLATKTTDGTGTGSFVSSIIGLTVGVTYYVRAYATNSEGAAYGNEIVFTTPLAVGDNYQGGIVAYILQPGDPGYNENVPHGLIAAVSDQSAGIQWWNGSFTTTGATGTAIGTGASNTAAIIASQGAGSYAASICQAYHGGGYTDWYLPSKDELTELYLNKTAIGGFANTFYWSSSEYDANFAWEEYLLNGSPDHVFGKDNGFNVRAVRSF